MPPILLILLVALTAFAAGLLLGRATRRPPAADAELAELRRRMDELAAALMEAGRDHCPPPG